MAWKHPIRASVSLIFCLAVISLAYGPASALAATYSFKPARATDGTVLFLIKDVRPQSVRAARVRVGNQKPHLVGLARARQAVRHGRLRLHVGNVVADSNTQGTVDAGGGAVSERGGGRPVAALKIVADTTPPETTITAGPSGNVVSRSASFSFGSSEKHSKFQCRLDGGSWSSCDSPKSYSQVALGTHTFYVAASDRAGNLDPTPATRTWTVEAPPSEPTPTPTPTPPSEPTPTPPSEPTPTPPSEPTPTPPSEPTPPSGEPLPPGALMYDGFGSANGPNGLITNEYAAWHSSDSTAVNSPIWQSDGGSLFSVPTTGEEGQPTNAAYTGKLDSSFADKYSQTYTHSNKMRFWTKASGFGNVRIDASIKAMSWSPEAPASWGGFKFYLRRELGVTDSSFYTVEPYIKDGHLYIQKKCLGTTGGGNFVAGEGDSPGGTYYVLASKTGYAVPLGSWHKIAATIHTNTDGSVTIGLYRDGVLLLQGVDHGVRSDGTGCAPLYSGHVGFRSDFIQYYLDNYEVTPG